MDRNACDWLPYSSAELFLAWTDKSVCRHRVQFYCPIGYQMGDYLGNSMYVSLSSSEEKWGRIEQTNILMDLSAGRTNVCITPPENVLADT